jgi:macrolide transport system ATP-binding/permease protein
VTPGNPDTTNRVLELRGVGRTFGSDPAVHALVDVDLTLSRGDWLAVTGPSGAGKSTLLNIIGCLDRPTSGSYLIDGIETAKLADNERAGLRSRRIGFVFQSFHLLPYRTVLENVMLAEVYRKQPSAGRRERAMAALERVGLSHRVDFMPAKLSGGERQRVAIARALVGAPSLLLCDEPTGNLDSKSTASILDLFQDLNEEGLTLVVVTHDENVAQRAARRVHMVDGMLTHFANGEKVTHRAGPPPAAGERPALRSGMTLRDLLDEALAGMFARPGRMMLTVLGVVIGLTALVATLGLTRTAGNRIISQFDQLAATELFISAKPGKSTGIVDPRAIPWDAPERLQRLNGVVAAGSMSEVDVGNVLVSSSPVQDPLNQSAFKLSVHAASPGLFTAARAQLATGRLPDLGHSARADRVAVLGPDAADRLGITGLGQLPAIRIGDHLYLVMGVLADVKRKPELLGSVIIPEGTARSHFALAGLPHRRPGAPGAAARRSARAQDRGPPGAPARARRGADGSQRHVPAARGAVALRRCHRHRQHHAGGRDGADRRDRTAPCHRRDAHPHRRAVPVRERLHGCRGRRHRGRRRRPHRGRRLGLPGLDARARPGGALPGAAGWRRHRPAVRRVSGAARRAPRARRGVPGLTPR